MIKELETRGHITRLPEVGRKRSAAVVKGSGRLARIVFAENVFAAEHVPVVNELCHLSVNGCMADRAERDQVLRSRGPSGFEIPCDGLPGSPMRRTTDNASNRGVTPGCGAVRTNWDPAASAPALGQSNS